MLTDTRQVAEHPIFMAERDKRQTYVVSQVVLEPRKRSAVFLYFEPEGLRAGNPEVIHVIRRDPHTKRVEGGCTYNFVLTPRS